MTEGRTHFTPRTVKQPCLYPLPDGRRCCECETCQSRREFLREFDNEVSATGGDRTAAANRLRLRKGFPDD